MSGRHFAPDSEQPGSFAWSGESQTVVDRTLAKYPESRAASAVIPLLDLAQRQEGWVSRAAIEAVAEQLSMAPIRVMEVASFYTMFNLVPIGKYHVQVCGTTPCWLRGVDQVYAALKEECGIGDGQTSEDVLFTVTEVECLGACVNAPMVQINDDFYEDLDKDNFRAVLQALRKGETPKANSQTGRQSSEAEGGATSLTEVDFSVKHIRQLNGEAAPEAPAPQENAAPAAAKDISKPALDDPARPPPLDAARDGQADDLKKVESIGPKIEETLNQLGIYHFDQVAAWTSEEAIWVDTWLNAEGRVERENWIGQAKALAGDG